MAVIIAGQLLQTHVCISMAKQYPCNNDTGFAEIMSFGVAIHE